MSRPDRTEDMRSNWSDGSSSGAFQGLQGQIVQAFGHKGRELSLFLSCDPVFDDCVPVRIALLRNEGLPVAAGRALRAGRSQRRPCSEEKRLQPGWWPKRSRGSHT